ncbi:NUDIX domain-containing protein [Knoellia locipacati]|uniref:NUDIX hydrolase n=1 Tax=Knoellia locipacati TaxID=882824 RepID=UPI00385040EC
MIAARPRVRVHVVAIDDEHRMLLDRRPGTQTWALPWGYLGVGEDPSRMARSLVHDTGAAPTMPRVQSVESAIEHGDHFLDVTLHCSAERIWKPTTGGRSSNALWWSLDEISSLELSPRARSALVNAWAVLWPQV